MHQLEETLGVGYESKHLVGGFIGLLATVIVFFEIYSCWWNIFVNRDYSFINNSIFYKAEDMNSFDVNIGVYPYNKSANFIFGVTGGDLWSNEAFDILNNPYIEFIGAQMTSGDIIDSVHELQHCEYEHLSFIESHTLGWFT